MEEREVRMAELEENVREENIRIQEILNSEDPDTKPMYKLLEEEGEKFNAVVKKEIEEKSKTERTKYGLG